MAFCQEAGTSRLWLKHLCMQYWLRLSFCQVGLFFLILAESFNSSWKNPLPRNWTVMASPVSWYWCRDVRRPSLCLGSRYLESQYEQPSLPRDIFANRLFVKLKPGQNLNHIVNHKFRRALTITYFDTLLMSVMEWTYKKILYVNMQHFQIDVDNIQRKATKMVQGHSKNAQWGLAEGIWSLQSN